MKPTIVNAFRGAIEPDSIAIEFGVAMDGDSQADTRVILSDRIELTPAAARHLAISLDEAVRRLSSSQAQRVGAAGVAGDRVTPRGRTPVHAPQDPSAGTAETLMQQVGALDVPYQYERSFRMAPGVLMANRFLLTFNKADLGQVALNRCLEIARQVGMPAGLQQQIPGPFAQAVCVHFGFEAGPDGVVCKFYLERAVAEEERVEAMSRDEPVLLHEAFKWMPGGDLRAVTRYYWYPQAPIESIRDRMSAIFVSDQDSRARALAERALDIAASRVDANKLQYLEVLEDDNERRSFDLNVYEADLQVKDLQPELNNIRDYFDIKPGHFQAIYDQVRTHSLGHVAGGVHRNGKEFFNIYHGVTSFPRFSRELG
jgi:tryptophan halogenase